jgi:subtilisin family serine protease
LALQAFESNPENPFEGLGSTATLAKALDRAIARAVDVLNLSFAGPRDQLVARLIRRALAQGIVVVAAAGNDGPDASPLYPAAYDGVIAVAATDHRDRPYVHGARGRHISVAAPGVDVVTTQPGETIAYVSGTSMAAAQISGVVALMRERWPELAPPQVKAILETTARRIDGAESGLGSGVVDAEAALAHRTRFAGQGGASNSGR